VIPLRDAVRPRRTPLVALAVMVLCVAGFGVELAVEATSGDLALEDFFYAWGFIPADFWAAVDAGDPTSPAVAHILSSMFLHGGWLHLLGNMLYLWIFANRLEDGVGHVPFLLLYAAGGVVAAVGHALADPASDIPAIGASGAISAVLGAYLVLYPRARIQSLVFLGFFYQLIAVPSVLVLGFWFVLQLIDGVAALNATDVATGGVAVWAHIGGFVAGLAAGLALRLVRVPVRLVQQRRTEKVG
jgi:membrane associated rhomboid family serine protease